MHKVVCCHEFCTSRSLGPSTFLEHRHQWPWQLLKSFWHCLTPQENFVWSQYRLSILRCAPRKICHLQEQCPIHVEATCHTKSEDTQLCYLHVPCHELSLQHHQQLSKQLKCLWHLLLQFVHPERHANRTFGPVMHSLLKSLRQVSLLHLTLNQGWCHNMISLHEHQKHLKCNLTCIHLVWNKMHHRSVSLSSEPLVVVEYHHTMQIHNQYMCTDCNEWNHPTCTMYTTHRICLHHHCMIHQCIRRRDHCSIGHNWLEHHLRGTDMTKHHVEMHHHCNSHKCNCLFQNRQRCFHTLLKSSSHANPKNQLHSRYRRKAEETENSKKHRKQRYDEHCSRCSLVQVPMFVVVNCHGHMYCHHVHVLLQIWLCTPWQNAQDDHTSNTLCWTFHHCLFLWKRLFHLCHHHCCDFGSKVDLWIDSKILSDFYHILCRSCPFLWILYRILLLLFLFLFL